MLDGIERFLDDAGFERGPWLAVAFAGGIGAWFMLDNPWRWLMAIGAALALAAGAAALLARNGRFPFVRQSLISMTLVFAAGCALVWCKSALVGAPPIDRPVVATIAGVVLKREDRPAENRVRLTVATRAPQTGRPIKARIALDPTQDKPGLVEGAQIALRARLMPPAPPMLPGGYNFARTAWFAGLSATGGALGPITVTQPGGAGGWMARLQASLSRHVRERLGGSSGAIAAALASGDRGGIAQADEDAMRDSGLAHLLSISGLHVSAVVACAYLLALRLLALWPWLALRVRLPLIAAGAGESAGIFYTLLTGAEVPTVRSCIGAVLVLAALALGREPLSLRMLAAAAFFVMLLWPEAVVGPSFQMSFAAVIAIVSLHGCAPAHAFLAPREESALIRLARQAAMLLIAGLVIELALMPIGLFHFHRAGVYGAFANVIAIPLTTLASMPLIALALTLDMVGAGAPVWWLAGKSIDVILALAHWVSARPGAVTMLPAMGLGGAALFVIGGLWLALWRGNVRLLGLIPVIAGFALLALLRPPDVLISGDGRHVGVVGEGEALLTLRDTRSDYARDNLLESAGMRGEIRRLADWPGAECSRDFCVLTLRRGGRDWRLLMGRTRDQPPERALVAACERVDIVVSERWLPRSCRPTWIKADRHMLGKTGGLTIDLSRGAVRTVAQTQGEHGWWRPAVDRPFSQRRAPGAASSASPLLQ